MKLSELMRFRHRNSVRENRLQAIADLGFKLLDERGWHEGKFYPKRYVLETTDGRRLDNGGEGYSSSSEAFHAATAESQSGQAANDSNVKAAKGLS